MGEPFDRHEWVMQARMNLARCGRTAVLVDVRFESFVPGVIHHRLENILLQGNLDGSAG
jgi:hypothetical protein